MSSFLFCIQGIFLDVCVYIETDYIETFDKCDN